MGPRLGIGEFLLRLPHIRQIVRRAAIVVRGQLDEINRQIGIFKHLAPAADQRSHPPSVIGVVRPDVRFALIPEYATQRKRRQRTDHRIVKHRRLPGMPFLLKRFQFLRISRRRFRHHAVCQRLPVFFQPGGLFRQRPGQQFALPRRTGRLGGNQVQNIRIAVNHREPFRRRPGINPGTAPVGTDQTDRHLQLLLQIPAEEITDRRKRTDRLRRTHLPGRFHIVERRTTHFVRHLEQTDLRVVGRGDFRIAVDAGHRAPLHIGLPGAEPDFADQDIRQFETVPALHRQSQRTTGRHRRQRHAPLARFIGDSRNGCVRLVRLRHFHRHRHRFARIGPAPDRTGPFPLQYHMIGEQCRQSYFRRRQRRRQSNSCRQPTLPVHFSSLLTDFSAY